MYFTLMYSIVLKLYISLYIMYTTKNTISVICFQINTACTVYYFYCLLFIVFKNWCVLFKLKRISITIQKIVKCTKFTNNKNECFNHSEVEEESEFRVCYKCKLYDTQNTLQKYCTKCLEALTLTKVKGLQRSMVVHVYLYLINIPEEMYDNLYW